MYLKKTLSIIFLVCFITTCAGNRTPSLKDIKSQPEKKLELHSVNLDKKFTSRIAIAPDVIIASLNKMDSSDKYESYLLNSQEKALFVKYYEFLPVKYKELMERKVAAVYIIKNFTGGGMTDCVFDKNGEMYIVLYLNSALLNTSLNDWINYRDRSAFTGNSSVMLKSNCASGHPALLHTLVHESSHIYDHYYHVTPYIAFYLVKPEDKKNTEFVADVWKDSGKPVLAADFSKRANMSFYGLGKKTDISLSSAMYRDLNKTPFSSLYGSTSWVEDFAETFTWYYLNKKFGIKYEVVVTTDGDRVIFSPTGNKAVTERYKYFKQIDN